MSCAVPLRSDVWIDYCIIEIVTHDRIKKGDSKVGFGNSLFVRLSLKTDRCDLGKGNYQPSWKIAFRPRRRRSAPVSKTNSVLGAFHSQAPQLASNLFGYVGSGQTLSSQTPDLQKDGR
jgi:hypothetical protein